MNKSRIERLAQLLPADAGIFTAGRQPGGAPPSLAERMAIALSAPDFLHRFVMEFVTHGEPMPPSAHESWLRRAHSHFAGENVVPDNIMLAVEQLTHAGYEFTRQVLNALLVSQDITFPQIAEQLDLNVDTVRCHEQLHFNVKDRGADAAYIARLVYPNGRFQSLRPDGVDELPIDQRLLMAGYTFGAREVLWLAGMTTDQNGPPSVEQSLKEFEQSLVQNALQLTRAGGLNNTVSPGIAHGKSVLISRRNESRNSPLPTSQTNDISLGAAILTSMPRSQVERDIKEAAAEQRLARHEAALGIVPV